jgi:hypothetical protein
MLASFLKDGLMTRLTNHIGLAGASSDFRGGRALKAWRVLRRGISGSSR